MQGDTSLSGTSDNDWIDGLGGIDLVRSSVDHALNDAIENLTSIGSADI